MVRKIDKCATRRMKALKLHTISEISRAKRQKSGQNGRFFSDFSVPPGVDRGDDGCNEPNDENNEQDDEDYRDCTLGGGPTWGLYGVKLRCRGREKHAGPLSRNLCAI